MKQKIINLIKNNFSLDLRSLALFRIGVGSLILIDLIQRSYDLVAHYTDLGIMPRVLLQSQGYYKWMISIHTLSGSLYWEVFLFVLAAIFATMLIFGYKTKLSTIVSFILLMSLQNRNQEILQNSDTLLRMFVFWGMFIPWHLRYSLDAKKIKAITPNQFLSIGTIALILQIAIVYLFTIAYKTDQIWYNGTAVFYSMHAEMFSTVFGRWLLNFPLLIRLLSYFSFAAEILIPYLLIIPFTKKLFRVTAVLLLLILHGGILFTMNVGLFPYVSLLGAIVLVPTFILEKVFRSNAIDLLDERSTNLLEIKNAVAGLAIVYVLLLNLTELPKPAVIMNGSVRWPSKALRLDQRWDMFSPYPPLEYGWVVIPGKTTKGQINLLTGTKVSWSKPANVASSYGNYRWKKFLLNINNEPSSYARASFGDYLCNNWNSTHSINEQITSLEVFYLSYPIDPKNSSPRMQKNLVMEATCETANWQVN